MDQTYQKLGELLLAKQLISASQLEEALNLQDKTGLRLGEVLVRHGFVDEQGVAMALATQYGYEIVDPNSVTPTAQALDLLSFGEAASQCLLPFRTDEDTIYCLVADPLNVPITDHLSSKHRKKVVLSVSPDTRLKARIIEAYRGELAFQSALSIRLPERFIRATPRHELESIVWIDAQDVFLERPVSLILVSKEHKEDEANLTPLKTSARFTESGVATVYDTFSMENTRVTVLERLRGQQLSESLQDGNRNTPSEAAKIVSHVADIADRFGKGDASWICSENVWTEGSQLKVSPIFNRSDRFRYESDVEALGHLLLQCVLGKYDCKFEDERDLSSSIPAGMLQILGRCFGNREDSYRSPREVHKELANYRWSDSSGNSAKKDLEREELLATLRVVKSPEKLTLWQRIFGRKAA